MCYNEVVTFAWLELLSFVLAHDTRNVPNNPELIFNWVDYLQLKRPNQIYVFPLVAFISFKQELV